MTQEQQAQSSAKLRTLADLPPLVDATAQIAAHMATWHASKVLAFDGVFGGIRSLLAVALARHTANILVLVPQAVDADIVSGDCIALGCNDSISLPLSATDGTPDSIRDVDYAERLQVLQRLRTRTGDDSTPLIVTAYVGAAMQLVPTPEAVAGATRQIAVGNRLDDTALRRWLAEAGFHATTAVQLPGEFSQRGGIPRCVLA